MTGFNELNGVPASGNSFLFREVLRDKWGFEGFVVSDWNSIGEMLEHGNVADGRSAGMQAVKAGVDMEMAGSVYRDNLKKMIEAGELDISIIDDAVRRILKVKFDLGLFEFDLNRQYQPISESEQKAHLAAAQQTALQSIVLLKNEKNALPLKTDLKKLAVIGPMANDRYEQLGTWIFDGDTTLTITPLMAFQDLLGADRVLFQKGLPTTRSKDRSLFERALKIAEEAETVIVILGEESILTGEAHSRAKLNLPGAQSELLRYVAQSGKKIILVIMTSRPLTIEEDLPYCDAVLYAWHPGSMGGSALAEIIFGMISPSGKLPVTFPRTVGQIPIYYSHKNTGRPYQENSFLHMEDIPVRSFQTSLGNTSHYMDYGAAPLYSFGYGLSYTTFEYTDLKLSGENISVDETLKVTFTLKNIGNVEAEEVAQLYIRDKVASTTRPVKELKAFKRVRLKPGESKQISFDLGKDQLGFFDRNGDYRIEEGEFQIWIGGDSQAKMSNIFTLK